MRRAAPAALALLLVAVTASQAAAVTTVRTWGARMGTDYLWGKSFMYGYADGSGRLTAELKSLRASTRYTIQIREGTCGSIGTLLASPGSITTTATGTYTGAAGLNITQMNTIWPKARYSRIIVRYASTYGSACGQLGFVVATRVRIPDYGIDLPVIPGPSGYPPCNVAMFMRALYQPLEPGVTFLFAHARTGMFLPLLTASQTNNGAAMIGRTVLVYTSNSRVHTYRINLVRRHVSDVNDAFDRTSEVLWLQTSEGPNTSYPKLIVEAVRISTTTTTYTASHPKAYPVAC